MVFSVMAKWYLRMPLVAWHRRLFLANMQRKAYNAQLHTPEANIDGEVLSSYIILLWIFKVAKIPVAQF